MYEKIDKELLTFVEDVLLNRRDDSTERLLEFAGTLDPKSKPCKVKRLNEAPPAANMPAKARSCAPRRPACSQQWLIRPMLTRVLRRLCMHLLARTLELVAIHRRVLANAHGGYPVAK